MSLHLLVFIFLTLHLLLISNAADPLGEYCNNDNIISNGSQLAANINKLLVELASKASSTGYIATSYGTGSNTVHGLAQCRGDVVNTKDCTACLQDAAKMIRQRCPDQADSRIWYDYCFLRFDVNNFIGNIDTGFGIIYYNVANVTEPEKFNEKLGILMDNIRSEAVEPNSRGLGKGETKLTDLVTLYALAQCIRDLALIDCAQCIAIAVEIFSNICASRKGCRVLYSSCYVRYELYPFFFPLDSNNKTAAATTSGAKMIKIIV